MQIKEVLQKQELKKSKITSSALLSAASALAHLITRITMHRSRIFLSYASVQSAKQSRGNKSTNGFRDPNGSETPVNNKADMWRCGGSARALHFDTYKLDPSLLSRLET